MMFAFKFSKGHVVDPPVATSGTIKLENINLGQLGID